MGAPDYMAPELCQGKEAGAPADVYALGVLMYEALRARAPFAPRTSRANPATTMKRHIFEKPLALHMRYGNLEHIKPYESVTMGALAKKAAQRQVSGQALCKELEALITGEMSTAVVTEGAVPQLIAATDATSEAPTPGADSSDPNSTMVAAGFAKPESRSIVRRVETVDEVLALLD